MPTVEKTLVLSFDEAATAGGGAVLAEWDEGRNVDAVTGEVKTSFIPGDTAYFVVQHDPAVRLTRAPVATDGDVVYVGPVTYQRTEELLFPLAATPVPLRYRPAGSPSMAWKGRVGSGLVIADAAATITGGAPALAVATYPCAFLLYRLQTRYVYLPAEETWPVAVVIYYEEIGA